MESCNEEEKELLMRVVKHIRCDPEKFWTNLQYNDRKVTGSSREDQQDRISYKNWNNNRNKLSTMCCWQHCYWDGGDNKKQAT